MRRIVLILLCLPLLGACSLSSLNPMTWFGGGEEAPVTFKTVAPAPDTSVLAASILSASSERTPAGTILHATGLAPASAPYNAVLRPVYRADGSFSHFEFRLYLPPDSVPGPPSSREITVARFLPRGSTGGSAVAITSASNSVTVPLR
jgi:hypothetical protein